MHIFQISGTDQAIPAHLGDHAHAIGLLRVTPMIRLPRLALVWRSVTEAWTDRNKEQEVECPITDTQAIESNPNDATAYLERGTAHFKASEFDSAIANFTKAIELKPNHASAYTNRGSAHYEKAEFDRAIADFTKAIELNPKLALAYSNLGWTYEAIGDEREAIAHYRKALEFQPSLEAARDNLKLLGATPERQPFYRQTKPRN
jgi:tetratricopeptide (TPR) repeat protein